MHCSSSSQPFDPLKIIAKMITGLVALTILGALIACSKSIENNPQRTTPIADEVWQNGAGIIGGEFYPKTNFKSYVVLITIDNDDAETSLCTGTFISNNLILTAAHCASPKVIRMGVNFGVDPLAQDGHVKIPIVRTYFPGSFHRRGKVHNSRFERNDIALIEFSGGLPPNAVVVRLPTPATLASVADLMHFRGSTNFDFVALGYGKTKGTSSSIDFLDLEGAGSLRTVTMQGENWDPELSYFTIDQKHTRGVCFGDSGGPAVVDNGALLDSVILGVASGVYGEREGEGENLGHDDCVQRSVYMNVTSYLAWITRIQADVNAN